MIYINLGCANGWGDKEDNFCKVILALLKNDRTYSCESKSNGRGYTETTAKTDYVEVKWQIDSSD